MQENTAVQETNSINQEQISGQNVVRVVEKTETVETKRLQEHYNFFGPVTFLYAVFYAFCMFRNGSGVTLPFFSRRHFTVFCLLAVKTGDYLEKRERLLYGQHSAAGGIHLLHRRMGDHRSEQAGGVSVSDVSAAESIF